MTDTRDVAYWGFLAVLSALDVALLSILLVHYGAPANGLPILILAIIAFSFFDATRPETEEFT